MKRRDAKARRGQSGAVMCVQEALPKAGIHPVVNGLYKTLRLRASALKKTGLSNAETQRRGEEKLKW
jgi:hypothetical protein